jgi:hypothetical protein
MFEDKHIAENLMKSLVDDLIVESLKNSKDGNCDYSSDTLAKLERLKQVMPVWSIESFPIEFDETDRKSNMFGGRPFTSKKHPWPLNSNDNPYYPLVQINLLQISELCSRDFGRGLLQVWLDISNSNLSEIIRFIDPADMIEMLSQDAPSIERINEIDKFGSWFGISRRFSFKFLGYMLLHWGDGDAEWDYDRDLSEKEVEILDRLEELSEANGYRSLSTNWLLGYPDRGSGAPAGRYTTEPKNLVQFATSDTFPLVEVSRYANIFYSEVDGDVAYFFDWNG